MRNLDNDIWFLLNSGRYVLANGIPHTEPFTLHKGLAFVMQQWLSGVVFWSVYATAGEFGLNLLIMLCLMLIVLLMYRLCMTASEGNFVVSFTVAITFCVFASFFITQRPIVFTLIIVLTELYILESFVRNQSLKCLYILPLLSTIQINLHAAMWPLLFIVLLPYIVESFSFKIGAFCNKGYVKKWFPICFILMILAGFLNPYGTEAMTYLVRSYGHPEISNSIIEMRSPDINSGLGLFIYLGLSVVLSPYLFFRRGRTTFRYILLTAGTLLMALSSIRNFPIFAACSFFPLSYYFKEVNLPIIEKEPSKRVIWLRNLLIVLIILLSSSVIIQSWKETTSGDEDLTNVINYVQEEADTGKITLYSGYNDGNLVEFMGLSPYIDARAEVFVKENNKHADIMEEYIELQDGSLYYKSVLDKYNFTHLIVSKKDILSTYLPHDKDYQLVYANASYELFKRIRQYE